MTFVFHPAARLELNQAVDYYEATKPGLGYEFLEEIYATINRVLRYPEAWSQLSTRTRRSLTKRFPSHSSRPAARNWSMRPIRRMRRMGAHRRKT